MQITSVRPNPLRAFTAVFNKLDDPQFSANIAKGATYRPSGGFIIEHSSRSGEKTREFYPVE